MVVSWPEVVGGGARQLGWGKKRDGDVGEGWEENGGAHGREGGEGNSLGWLIAAGRS